MTSPDLRPEGLVSVGQEEDGRSPSLRSGSGCQPSASAAVPASSRGGIPNAWPVKTAAELGLTQQELDEQCALAAEVLAEIMAEEAAAQAIEARRAATGTGAVEDESAVAEGGAPKGSGQ